MQLMRWELGRRSNNVQDRRGSGIGPSVAVGGGIGTILLALVVTLLGGDPGIILDQNAPREYPDATNPQVTSPEEEEKADFVSVVLADTEDTWHALFQQRGATYEEPQLVLFSGFVESACGSAEAAMGPFYCPRDQNVYIDLSFYDALKSRYQAPGDFAQAYVIAHEVGHHVQNLMGISGRVQAMQQQVSQTEANQLSVRLELQADCFAGIWAHHAERSRQLLETGDIEEALTAASSIGDDRLQQESRGYVVPESFTHGSSEQRVYWFKQGFQSGEVDQCNTFAADNL